MYTANNPGVEQRYDSYLFDWINWRSFCTLTAAIIADSASYKQTYRINYLNTYTDSKTYRKHKKLNIIFILKMKTDEVKDIKNRTRKIPLHCGE